MITGKEWLDAWAPMPPFQIRSPWRCKMKMLKAPRKGKALLLGMCALVLAIVLEWTLDPWISMRFFGGFVEESVKILLVLWLAKSLRYKEKIHVACWVGIGFWLLETLFLVPSGKPLWIRILTLFGHATWPMIGVEISERKSVFLGILVAGILHQAFNMGPTIIKNGTAPAGLGLMIAVLLVSAFVQNRLSSKEAH